MCRKANNQAGIFKGNWKTRNSTRRLFGPLCLISSFNMGRLSNSMWHILRKRSKPRKLARCRWLLQRWDPSISRGRATGLAAARRPTASSTEKTAHLASKHLRPSQTRLFIPLCLWNHTSTNQVTTSLRRPVAIPPSPLPVWGFGAPPTHPRDPKSDVLLAGAGKTSLPLAAVLRGERAP